MTDADQPPTDPPIRVYAPPQWERWLMAGCLVFFVIAMVGSVTLALINADGSFRYPVISAIVGGCFWGGMAILAALALVYYYRGRVYTSDDGLVQIIGLFRTRTFRLSEVTQARWRGWPMGGSLVLYPYRPSGN